MIEATEANTAAAAPLPRPGGDRDALPAEWQRAFGWIEAELGGRITAFQRQPRWRPAWFLDLERDGQIVPLYFRGDRSEGTNALYPLEHEMTVLRVLERYDIPVPHVYGFCPDPRGIVMQRCPGRPLASLATESPAQRRTVLAHYVEILARIHGIDPGVFEAVGLQRPRTPEALAFVDFDHWERNFRKAKRRPEPVIEFVIRWVRRNVPPGRRRAALLHGDAGQFFYQGSRICALHDFELACLGDPAADLAAMRCRDTSEPLGDLSWAIGRYSELTGEPVNLDVVDYHTVRFSICTPMSTARLVANPMPGLDLVQWLGWYLVYARAPMEIIARRLDVPLTPIELPAPRQSRQSPAYVALTSLLQAEGETDEFRTYRMDTAQRLTEYLRRADLFGAACEEQDLDEIGKILRRRLKNWVEADAALEAYVQSADPARDADLVGYFHRRLLRQEAILKPVMRELEHVRLQPIH